MGRKKRRCRFTGKRERKVSKHHYYPRPYHKGHRDEWDYIQDRLHEYIHEYYSNSELAHFYNDYASLYQLLVRDGKILNS